MRELAMSDVMFISGGEAAPTCTAPTTVSVGGASVTTSNSGSLGQVFVDIYDGLVEVTSHVIERVAEAL